MSTDLRTLIAQCETAKETGEWARLWLAVTPDEIKELARDAARFRHLVARTVTHGTTAHYLEWHAAGTDLRAAIDADMGDKA